MAENRAVLSIRTQHPMATLDRAIWPARLSTFVLAALVAASAVYWGLRWSEPLATPGYSGEGASQRPIDTARVAQLLGASAAPADARRGGTGGHCRDQLQA